ncbi:Recombinase [Pirellulimonas nuda]|uniref:Recombinase n=1 Tax=Pirellulimonas nuda TaxID=2528009 RepID=A0A518DAA8_9BACT|nr:recombinase family protein [Pirellulimonas nuda]QDU88427.1 Recombinase [Pirellulimonas nuda]
MILLNPPLEARDGHTLRVLAICRISSTDAAKQDVRSLDDQENLIRNWVASHWEGPADMKVIAGRGSGERLDRQESRDAEDALETRQYDLVISEDLGRIFRRMQAFEFCEIAEDYDTRVIALNDHVDTGAEGWRISAFFASMRHEMYNADTANRIRRTHNNRFRQGGVVQFVIFGYEKPLGAKNDIELRKADGAEAIYDRWFSMLEEGASFAEVADWLNAENVPVGKYCRGTRWTGEMVSRTSRDPLLKGQRVRNRVVTKRVNSTGRRRSVRQEPEGWIIRECPHLQMIDPNRFDRVGRMLKKRNAKNSRKRSGSSDPRAHVPRKRTLWPGQHLKCGVCGRTLGHFGTKERPTLMCSGADEYRCWNSVCLNAKVAGEKLSEAIMAAVSGLPEFDTELLARVEAQADEAFTERGAALATAQRAADSARRRVDNLAEAVAASGCSAVLLDHLRTAEDRCREMTAEVSRLERLGAERTPAPSIERVRAAAMNSVAGLAIESQEFGRVMHDLAPEITVYPVRGVDGGRIHFRAVVRLDASCFAENLDEMPSAQDALRIELEVDLFDPPKPMAVLNQAVAMLCADGAKMKQREAAAALGTSQPAVQRALKLHRLMQELGLGSPWRQVLTPPEDDSKLRRYRHPRYRFEPLEGFPRMLSGGAPSPPS